MVLDITVSRDARFNSITYTVREKGADAYLLRGDWRPMGWNGGPRPYTTVGWPTPQTLPLEAVLRPLASLVGKLSEGGYPREENTEEGIFLHTPSPGDLLLPISTIQNTERFVVAVAQRDPYLGYVCTGYGQFAFVRPLAVMRSGLLEPGCCVQSPVDISAPVAEFFEQTADRTIPPEELRGILRMIFPATRHPAR